MAVRLVDQGYYYSQPYTWDNTSSGEYPIPGPYPSDYKTSHSDSGREVKYGNACQRPRCHSQPPAGRRHHHHNNNHRVRFAGFEEPPAKVVRKEEEVVVDESVDDEADDYIKAKHRSFEQRLWQTFKEY